MKKIVGSLILLLGSWFGNSQAIIDDVWLRQALVNVDVDVERLRAGLKEELEEKKSVDKTHTVRPLGKCETGSVSCITYPKLLVCLSFAVPETTWISLGRDVEAVDGVIVLQGLPNGSFQELASRLIRLREKGFTAQVDLNPIVFQNFQVIKVPTFIIPTEKVFDKLSGNVSVRCALELFEARGETKDAKILLETLKGKQNRV